MFQQLSSKRQDPKRYKKRRCGKGYGRKSGKGKRKKRKREKRNDISKSQSYVSARRKKRCGNVAKKRADGKAEEKRSPGFFAAGKILAYYI